MDKKKYVLAIEWMDGSSVEDWSNDRDKLQKRSDRECAKGGVKSAIIQDRETYEG